MKRISKRKTPIIEVEKRVLILCEGETECEYFIAFKQDSEHKQRLASVSIDVYKPQNYSPLGLVEEAKRKKKAAKFKHNAFDEVWIVFDRDKHAGVPEAFKEASDAGIKTAYSSICFEYWIVLHFEYTTRVFKNSDEAVSYIKSKHYADYKKGDECFTFIKDKMKTAIKNANKIYENAHNDINCGIIKLHNCDPYTNMHELVQVLLKIGDKS